MTTDLRHAPLVVLSPPISTAACSGRAAPGDVDDHGRILGFSGGDDMGVWLTREETRRAAIQYAATAIPIPNSDAGVLP